MRIVKVRADVDHVGTTLSTEGAEISDINKHELKPEIDGQPASEEGIIALLEQRAKRNASAHRWDVRILILSYTILVINTFIAIETKRTELVALIAIPGLAAIWIVSTIQGKKAEKNALRDALREYRELLAMSAAQNPPQPKEAARPVSDESPLSDRELQVLTRIAKGDSNKEAALALFISEQTVKNHLKHIYSKLNVNDRTAAVLTATKNGWIAIEGD